MKRLARIGFETSGDKMKDFKNGARGRTPTCGKGPNGALKHSRLVESDEATCANRFRD
jgi:hypothetical protein